MQLICIVSNVRAKDIYCLREIICMVLSLCAFLICHWMLIKPYWSKILAFLCQYMYVYPHMWSFLLCIYNHHTYDVSQTIIDFKDTFRNYLRCRLLYDVIGNFPIEWIGILSGLPFIHSLYFLLNRYRVFRSNLSNDMMQEWKQLLHV